MARARIYRPAKNAMQSGRAKTKLWVLDFVSTERDIDPLMGWTGMDDTLREIELFFPSREAAVAYAKERQLDFEVTEPKTRAPILKAYSDNFKYTG